MANLINLCFSDEHIERFDNLSCESQQNHGLDWKLKQFHQITYRPSEVFRSSTWTCVGYKPNSSSLVCSDLY